jgi:putative membrane protein
MKDRPMRIDEKRAKIKRVESKSLTLEDISSFEKSSFERVKGFTKGIKKSLTLFGLFISIIVVGTLYDTVSTLSSMFQNAPFIALIYLGLIVSFIGVAGYLLYGEIRDFKRIKEIGSIQEEALKHQNSPTASTREFAKKLLDRYIDHFDKEVANSAKEIYGDLDLMLVEEIMPSIEERIFKRVDRLSRDAISKYSTQTAISTAISPVAFIDAILIISRAHVMVFDIAKIYGYRPHLLGKLTLYKKVFTTLAFASVTDILANHSHDIMGASILSKLSVHSAQGVANGILMARVGVSAVKACKPTSYNDKEGFLKSLSKMMIEAITKSKKGE